MGNDDEIARNQPADPPSGPMDLRGVSHVALVCSNMARTVDFYSRVLGLRLTKTVELPAGMGQHFFFDIGNGDSLAFFWFADGRAPAPGVAAPIARPDNGDSASAVGSMNHLALEVPEERLDEYRARLLAHGVDCSVVVNHDDSEWTVSEDVHPGVFVRSIYFQDPDGTLLELAAWHRALDEHDVRHAPIDADALVAANTTREES
jgi:catechol 2,3-dioxygenase-like lactoylglutathione lyase family enzyme